MYQITRERRQYLVLILAIEERNILLDGLDS